MVSADFSRRSPSPCGCPRLQWHCLSVLGYATRWLGSTNGLEGKGCKNSKWSLKTVFEFFLDCLFR